MSDYDITPEAESPAWAGVKLAEGQVRVLPAAGKKSSTFSQKDWGAPIAPVVVPGVPWEAAPGPVDQRSVERACGALLNNGCAAESSTTIEGVLKKWDRQRTTKKPAEKSWPLEAVVSEKPPAKKGKENTEVK